MKFVTLAAPVEQFDEIVERCVLNQQFHVENAQQVMKEVRNLRPLLATNPYTSMLRLADGLLDRLGIAAAYQPMEEEMTLEAAEEYLRGLETQLDEIEGKMNSLRQEITDDRAEAEQLDGLSGYDLELSKLRSLEYLRFRYGYMPKETYDSFQSSLDTWEDLYFFPVRTERGQVFGFYFTSRAASEKVDTLFNSLHFVRLGLALNYDGTAEESIQMLRCQADDDEKTLQDLETQLHEISQTEKEKLLAMHSWLYYRDQARDLRRYGAQTKNSFYLVGWVPGEELPALQEIFKEFPDLAVVVDDPSENPSLTPPTKLKNGPLGRLFEPFLKMYGLPGYHEIDPTRFMAITYCLFFAIMFGDVGQGLGLFVIGLLWAKARDSWLARIVACCGIASTISGFVYGSVFGMEDLLPWGFKILEGNNVIILLGIALGLGVFMLGFVMVMNLINGVHQHDFDKILFGANGVAGIVFYLGIIVAVLVTLLFPISLLKAWYILPVIVLPLVLILFREPLSKLCAGDPDWKPKSIGNLLVAGFFELFENVLSYVTNTLSFLRVAAYAITHVSLMLVIMSLGGDGFNPIIMVIGNLFVMGFEGLLVGIQVLRLEFYELFGRFYTSGGREFCPKVIDYTTKSV